MTIETKMNVAMDELPNIDSIPQPTGWRILVQPIKVEEMTAGGVVLPASAMEAKAYLRYVARVVAMGDECYLDDERFGPEPWCEVGDWIVYGSVTGLEIKINSADGKPLVLRLINDDEVLARAPDPKSLIIYC